MITPKPFDDGAVQISFPPDLLRVQQFLRPAAQRFLQEPLRHRDAEPLLGPVHEFPRYVAVEHVSEDPFAPLLLRRTFRTLLHQIVHRQRPGKHHHIRVKERNAALQGNSHRTAVHLHQDIIRMIEDQIRQHGLPVRRLFAGLP